jgi:hypothetical protein
LNVEGHIAEQRATGVSFFETGDRKHGGAFSAPLSGVSQAWRHLTAALVHHESDVVNPSQAAI